jgi:hypothetical protein
MHIEGVCVPGTGRERRGEDRDGGSVRKDGSVQSRDGNIYNILTQANNRFRLYMVISVISAFGFTFVKKPLSPHFTLCTVQTQRTI